MASNVEPNGGGFKYLRRYLLRGGMRGLGDSTQHELKVLGEQGVHTGGLARLAAGVANFSHNCKRQAKTRDFDAYELSSGRQVRGD